MATELAKEHDRAADRTIMAWVRTALALIGFGSGVGKPPRETKSRREKAIVVVPPSHHFLAESA